MDPIQVSISTLELAAAVVAFAISYTLFRVFRAFEDMAVGLLGLGFLMLGGAAFSTGLLILFSPALWPAVDFLEGLRSVCKMMGGMVMPMHMWGWGLPEGHMGFVYVYAALSLVYTMSYLVIALGYTVNLFSKVESKGLAVQVFPLLALGESFSIALLMYILVAIALNIRWTGVRKTFMSIVGFALITASHIVRLAGLMIASPDVLLMGEAIRPLGLIVLLALLLRG